MQGYYVDAVSRNQKKTEENIRNQLQEDWQAAQLSLFETVDLCVGKQVGEP